MSNNIKAIIKSTLTCGDCAGFKREILIPETKGCSLSGKSAENSICPKFRSDVLEIKQKIRESGSLLAFLDLVSEFDVKDLKLVGAALLTEARTRNNGFVAGQKIWVRIKNASNRNYISNFVTARVLSADADYVRLTSDDGKLGLTYPNDGNNGPSLYTEDTFKPLLRLMKEANNYVDPMDAVARVKAVEPVTYKKSRKTDDVQRFEDEVRTKPKRRKRSEAYTLADIVMAIESGSDLGADVDEETGHVALGNNRYVKRATQQPSTPRKRTIELSDLTAGAKRK
jgi:hypothetical protein